MEKTSRINIIFFSLAGIFFILDFLRPLGLYFFCDFLFTITLFALLNLPSSKTLLTIFPFFALRVLLIFDFYHNSIFIISFFLSLGVVKYLSSKFIEKHLYFLLVELGFTLYFIFSCFFLKNFDFLLLLAYLLHSSLAYLLLHYFCKQCLKDYLFSTV